MALIEDKILVAVIGLAAFYLAYRIFSGVSKSSKPNRDYLDKVLTSEEYKVKGRFE